MQSNIMGEFAIMTVTFFLYKQAISKQLTIFPIFHGSSHFVCVEKCKVAMLNIKGCTLEIEIVISEQNISVHALLLTTIGNVL